MRAQRACSGVTWLWRAESSQPARRAVEIDELEQLLTLDLPDSVPPERGVRDDDATMSVATGMGEAVVSSSVRLSRVAGLLVQACVALAVIVVILTIVCVAAAVQMWSITGVVFHFLVGVLLLEVAALVAYFFVGWRVKQ